MAVLEIAACPEKLHAVGHDAILIDIVVSDLGRSSCPLASLCLLLLLLLLLPSRFPYLSLSCPPSFSRRYLLRNEHRIDFHLAWLPLATDSDAHSIKLIDSTSARFVDRTSNLMISFSANRSRGYLSTYEEIDTLAAGREIGRFTACSFELSVN